MGLGNPRFMLQKPWGRWVWELSAIFQTYVSACIFKAALIKATTPQKSNIDTKNDVLFKCISFQIWLFWGIHVSFGGVLLYLNIFLYFEQKSEPWLWQTSIGSTPRDDRISTVYCFSPQPPRPKQENISNYNNLQYMFIFNSIFLHMHPQIDIWNSFSETSIIEPPMVPVGAKQKAIICLV